MPAPTIVTVATPYSGGGGTTITWTRASDGLSDAVIQPNDLLLMHFGIASLDSDGELFPGQPADFLTKRQYRHNTGLSGSDRGNHSLFYRRVGALASEPATYQLVVPAWSATRSWRATIAVVRGSHLIEPFADDEVNGTELGTAVAVPNVDVPADSLICCFVAGGSASVTNYTFGGGLTEQYDGGFDNGRAVTLGMGSRTEANAGSYGGTVAGSATRSVNTIAIKPASANRRRRAKLLGVGG